MSAPPVHSVQRPSRRLLLLFGVVLFPAAALPPLGAAEVKCTVRIGTLPGLRYDLKRFDVRPGAEVELVFSNTDTMLHNLVIVMPGTRIEVVNAALALGAKAPEVDFVPETPHVLWATKVVASGESFTLRFTAPATPGEFPYVCTYPGHGFIMYGTMRVTNDPKKPVANTGPIATHATHAAGAGHAVLKRTFMPDAGPASIAVQLPGGHSYCWDAGACCFRYAWKGGFTEPVYRKPDKLLGEVYYREGNDFPLRIGTGTPRQPAKVRFLGYGFDESGVPEFEYEMDGILVRERLEVRDDRLLRRFKTTPASSEMIWFSFDPTQAPQLSSTGRRQGNYFVFSGGHAREFYLTITPGKAPGKPVQPPPVLVPCPE